MVAPLSHIFASFINKPAPRSKVTTASNSRPRSQNTAPTNLPMGPGTPLPPHLYPFLYSPRQQQKTNPSKSPIETKLFSSYKIQPNIRGIGLGRAMKLYSSPPIHLPSHIASSFSFLPASRLVLPTPSIRNREREKKKRGEKKRNSHKHH